MKNNSDHAMFPDATHDEQAMQSFMKTLRVYSLEEFHAGNRSLLSDKFDGFAEPGAAQPSRTQMRHALEDEPHHRQWSSMVRVTQEMLYETVGPSIERQLPDLIARANALKGRTGSVRTDPTLTIPKYLSAVDIHCKPGSYHQELAEDDIFAGAEYDRTYRLYSMGLNGPNLDAYGWSLVQWIKANYPDLKPKRILDMGCTIGHSTLPYAEAFGDDVEVHAIDVSAPCVRYAHARAVAMDRPVHFSQQNAEHTDFEDGSFDLIISHLLMHETSRPALRNIFKESHRLLREGGVMAHADGVSGPNIYQKYYAEWMAHYNNEPFLGTIQDEDFAGICDQAGFHDHTLSFEMPLSRQGDNDDPGHPRHSMVIAARR